MVIWIIGMSGSGKTTLGIEIFKNLRKTDDKWIFLDGDMIRAIMGGRVGHTLEERVKNGYRISKLCKVLDMQGFNVIACVLSISLENQKYNRQIFSDYKEVYIDVELNELIERDNKNLYKRALNGEIKNVVGIDIEFPRPINPEYVLDNNKDNLDFTDQAIKIIKAFNIEMCNDYKYTKANILESPEKYQYTDYEGKDFFNTYKNNRNQALDFLACKLDKYNLNISFIEGSNEIEAYVSRYLNEQKNIQDKDCINTKVYLIDKWNKIRKDKISKEEIDELFLIINKFEVSKKIYSSYKNKNFENDCNIHSEIINYTIFSNLLLSLLENNISKNKKYIIFNTVLKLDDLIISVIDNLEDYDEIFLSYICLKRELINYDLIKEESLC